MNALERYRKTHELTFEALGELAGYDRGNAHKHCKAERIPDGAALRYHVALGIPLPELRPDLAPTPGQSSPEACERPDSAAPGGGGKG